MRCVPIPREKGTVIILGAGSSYGSTVNNAPPTMVSFVRDGRKRVKSDYSRLWRFLERMGYSAESLDAGTPNLEDIYSALHIISNALWHETEKEFLSNVGEDFWKIPPVAFVESFILEVTNLPSLDACQKTCKHHDAIVRTLRKGDTIISFNYDLICDASLARLPRWSELGGYGFPCFPLLGEEDSDFDTESPCDIALLKLHGSLNWKVLHDIRPLRKVDSEGASFVPTFNSFHERLLHQEAGSQPRILVKPIKEVRERAYEGPLAPGMADFYDSIASGLREKDEMWKISGVEQPPRETMIVPPTILKFGDPRIPSDLIRVWSAAYKALATAGRLVCIGYSFPPADIQFTTLFRLAIKDNPNGRLSIEVVNPDPEATVRLTSLAPKALVRRGVATLREYVE